MPTISTDDLSFELARAKKGDHMFDKLARAAQNHNLDLGFLLAIASRETNLVNELGDFVNGEAHGVGILQIDIQHDLARQARDSGSWKTHPEPLIDFGARMLRENIDWARATWPQFGGPNNDGWLKIAASAYNAGRGGAKDGVDEGDSDKFTTQHDYGRDVLARMRVLQDLLN